MKEIEVKILEIDTKDTLRKLEKIGAKKIGDFFYTRIIFAKSDKTIPLREWIRLRTDGSYTTLTYKKLEDKSIGGITEIEVEVSDFGTAAELLKKIGLKQMLFQESKRIQYKFDNIEFCIDFWPNLPPYLEIEAQSKAKLEQGITLLGFTLAQTTTKTTEELFRDMGIDINKITELRFKT